VSRGPDETDAFARLLAELAEAVLSNQNRDLVNEDEAMIAKAQRYRLTPIALVDGGYMKAAELNRLLNSARAQGRREMLAEFNGRVTQR